MLKGFGTVLSDLKGKAQALIGQMLMSRNILNQLAVSSDPNIQAQAQALVAQQTDLETQLGDVNTKINSGNVSIADYANIGLFLVKARTQVDAVNTLAQAGGVSASGDVTGDYVTKVGIGAAIVGVVGLGIYLFSKRR
jgi:hypothetical protein